MSLFINRGLLVVLDWKSSQEYPANAGVPQGSSLGPALFLLCLDGRPDNYICSIVIYHYSQLYMWSGIWYLATARDGCWTWIWFKIHCRLGQEMYWWFQCWKNATFFFFFFLTSLLKLVLLMWRRVSFLEEKSSFKLIELSFSSQSDWGSYIISIPKTACKKIGGLIRSRRFLYPEVALYLCKSTIQFYMGYCCHVWVSAPGCYLKMSDKVQKRTFRAVDSPLVSLLNPCLIVNM